MHFKQSQEPSQNTADRAAETTDIHLLALLAAGSPRPTKVPAGLGSREAPPPGLQMATFSLWPRPVPRVLLIRAPALTDQGAVHGTSYNLTHLSQGQIRSRWRLGLRRMNLRDTVQGTALQCIRPCPARCTRTCPAVHGPRPIPRFPLGLWPRMSLSPGPSPIRGQPCGPGQGI